jgi:transposase InsO family protein
VIAGSADLLRRLPVTAACAQLNLGRGSYYRALEVAADGGQVGTTPAEEAAPLQALEAVVLTYPGYGYPRVTRQLQREGWRVNHKRVYRLRGAAGLLHPRKRRQVRTTDSEHGFPIYPNLLPACGWRELKEPSQAWGADLTYLRLGTGFCYLAVVLDLFSRRIVGWNLSESLEAKGALAAL